jgi:dolichol-phosphate mannosyltransferase
MIDAATQLSCIRLGITCPMANESDNAVAFVRGVLAQCGEFKQAAFFAVLDKVTTDNTMELLREFAQREPRLRVVWAPENRCVVDAYVRGYRECLAAGCDWILEIDAGFSHQPEDLPGFFQAMQDGCACVFGSRFMKGGSIASSSLKRTLVSRSGTVLANVFLGTRLSDMTSGFELFSRAALEMVLARGIHSRAHFFQTEIKTYCRNLKIVEVPIHYRSPSPRLTGAAISDALRELRRLFLLRLRRKL